MLTARVVHRLQQDGFCYPSTSGYKGLKTMLISAPRYIQGLYRDNGKENGDYYNGLYKGII